jgi:CelD/BcsL family acetyltransferase involved in cellulose biosynthesis
MAVMTAAADVGHIGRDDSVRRFTWADLDIVVAHSRARVDQAWAALEALEVAAMFQSRAFASAWAQVAADKSGETLVYVAGYRGDEPVFVLPLALTRTLGARVLTWAAQSHANYGMGLFHPDLIAEFAAGARDVDALITTVGRAVGADIVHLQNQPVEWAGRPNPLASSVRAMLSANDTFVLAFEDDFHTQYKRLFSGRTLSNLKRKQRKLEDFGKPAFEKPQEASRREHILGWFFATKTAQLAASGCDSPFAHEEIQDLYRTMARDSAAFEIEALNVDETHVAVGLSQRDGRTSYLLNSVHQGAEFARSSPGALLLHRMVAAAHASGARVYDFGPGELPYKLEWEPKVTPLVFTTHLINPVHVLAYAALVFKSLLKSKVKRDPQLSALVWRLRSLKARMNTGGAA